MSSTSKSGIQTSADGSSFIPSSQRADGSTRKEIRVRPGYRPPEDVERYKNRSAEAWKNRGSGGIPGVEAAEQDKSAGESKSKNAKRREAAKKRQEAESTERQAGGVNAALSSAMDNVDLANSDKLEENWRDPTTLASNLEADGDGDLERQKKIRNQLKKLKAVRELKEKKNTGEKLSHDQLMKIGKEEELLRDLKKLNYYGDEVIDELRTTALHDVNLNET